MALQTPLNGRMEQSKAHDCGSQDGAGDPILVSRRPGVLIQEGKVCKVLMVSDGVLHTIG